MNSKQIGNITEVQCMLSFLKLGYQVLVPYGDCDPYDFVVYDNKNFYRVQAKTSSSTDNGNSFKFHCRTSHRKDGHIVNQKYSTSEVDYFATIFNEQCYLIPVNLCGAEKRLRLLPSENNQTRGVSWAKDYELEEVVKNW